MRAGTRQEGLKQKQSVLGTSTCYNMYCKKELPGYRIDKQTVQLGKNWFCVDCLKSSSNSNFGYKCVRKDCINIIQYCTGRVPKKYCSDLCRRRTMNKAGFDTVRNCLFCNKPVTSKLGRSRKYCNVDCNQRFIRSLRSLKRMEVKRNRLY